MRRFLIAALCMVALAHVAAFGFAVYGAYWIAWAVTRIF